MVHTSRSLVTNWVARLSSDTTLTQPTGLATLAFRR